VVVVVVVGDRVAWGCGVLVGVAVSGGGACVVVADTEGGGVVCGVWCVVCGV
jgi:hypothetical protein